MKHPNETGELCYAKFPWHVRFKRFIRSIDPLNLWWLWKYRR